MISEFTIIFLYMEGFFSNTFFHNFLKFILIITVSIYILHYVHICGSKSEHLKNSNIKTTILKPQQFYVFHTGELFDQLRVVSGKLGPNYSQTICDQSNQTKFANVWSQRRMSLQEVHFLVMSRRFFVSHVSCFLINKCVALFVCSVLGVFHSHFFVCSIVALCCGFCCIHSQDLQQELAVCGGK